MNGDLILHSGGLDSSVCLAMASDFGARQPGDALISLGINYGQNHESREGFSANALSDYYKAERIIHSISRRMFEGYGSTIMDKEAQQPNMSYDELREQEGPSPTYVPFRNGNLLSIATAYALKYKCSRVWFGAHKDDAHNWAYPDCTPEFIGAMYTAIDIGTYHQVSLITPFSVNTKAEIVEQGFNLKVPMELTYSCYVGEKLHCGTCPTCVSRIEAFKQSGVEDKTEYANSIIA